MSTSVSAAHVRRQYTGELVSFDAREEVFEILEVPDRYGTGKNKFWNQVYLPPHLTIRSYNHVASITMPPSYEIFKCPALKSRVAGIMARCDALGKESAPQEYVECKYPGCFALMHLECYRSVSSSHSSLHCTGGTVRFKPKVKAFEDRDWGFEDATPQEVKTYAEDHWRRVTAGVKELLRRYLTTPTSAPGPLQRPGAQSQHYEVLYVAKVVKPAAFPACKTCGIKLQVNDFVATELGTDTLTVIQNYWNSSISISPDGQVQHPQTLTVPHPIEVRHLYCKMIETLGISDSFRVITRGTAGQPQPPLYRRITPAEPINATLEDTPESTAISRAWNRAISGQWVAVPGSPAEQSQGLEQVRQQFQEQMREIVRRRQSRPPVSQAGEDPDTSGNVPRPEYSYSLQEDTPEEVFRRAGMVQQEWIPYEGPSSDQSQSDTESDGSGFDEINWKLKQEAEMYDRRTGETTKLDPVTYLPLDTQKMSTQAPGC
ncbi:hypothetical protein BJ508DRAFT_331029 [Ascobolus immersus RN42]|uniref:Uncharacterized protein n=1 Tax=Ascobolus immersus RN42 TaxID=1160509 RepID=A0A3N4HXB4_ASCIM|nr:hypothetical protein BJ508DRAFT_331029 [Ascobolus immersus RN42]